METRLPLKQLNDGTRVVAISNVDPDTIDTSRIKFIQDIPYYELNDGSLVLATVLVDVNGDPLSSGSSTPASTLLTGIVSSWKLGEGAGLTRVDSHGTNHLSDNGTVGQVNGVNGKAAEFGTDKWLSIAANSSLQVGSGSFELVGWVNGLNLSTSIGILCGRWSNANQYEFLVYYASAKFGFAIGDETGIGLFGQVATSGTLTNGVDYLVRVQYDITVPSISIAINGGAFETSLVAPSFVGATAAELRFGKGEEANPFYNDHHMNHWNLWNRKLTPTEWATLWNSGDGVVYPFTGFP